MNVFRFSSEQIETLFKKSMILNNLRRIEIEDDTEDRREWHLKDMLETLQQLPSLAEVVIGLILTSDLENTIFRLESRCHCVGDAIRACRWRYTPP